MKCKGLFLVIVLISSLCLMGMTYSHWTDTQNKVHEIAEIAREIGLDEEDPIIQRASYLWLCEENTIRILANVIFNEAGCKYCTDRHQQLVACVILNRIRSDEFPNTIEEVISQRRQYSKKYLQNLPTYLESDDDMKRCFDNAILAYLGKVECPDNVLYQSEYSDLGSGHYEVYYVKALNSTTYFSYG